MEIVGHYNPRKNPAEVVLKRERIDYWLSRGAQPSDTVRGFLRSRKEEPQSPQEQVA